MNVLDRAALFTSSIVVYKNITCGVNNYQASFCEDMFASSQCLQHQCVVEVRPCPNHDCINCSVINDVPPIPGGLQVYSSIIEHATIGWNLAVSE